MQHKLISGDNHIDLTYCPADLWSAQAPAKWKTTAPRVEERNDGQHWFVDDKDRGMWNGVGPGFLPYTPGSFGHVDEMKEAGFAWDSHPGAAPRPTTPELRLADLDRDGLEKEIIYGCLMINDLIEDAELRVWTNARYNDWAADFAKRSDPGRVFPLAIIPNTDPAAAAAEVRRCAKMGLKGGDLAFKRMGLPLYHRDWYALWEAAAECKFPISFHSTGFKAVRAPDTPEMEKEYATQHRLVRSALFQLDTMEVLVSILASGACEKYPDFNFVLAALCVRPPRHRISRPCPQPRLQAEALRLFQTPGLRHLPAGQVPRADRAADRRGQHHLGRRLSASRLHLAEFARDPDEEPRRLLRQRSEEDRSRQRSAALQPELSRRVRLLRRRTPCYLCGKSAGSIVHIIF
jgi:uncharacterized protein